MRILEWRKFGHLKLDARVVIDHKKKRFSILYDKMYHPVATSLKYVLIYNESAMNFSGVSIQRLEQDMYGYHFMEAFNFSNELKYVVLQPECGFPELLQSLGPVIEVDKSRFNRWLPQSEYSTYLANLIKLTMMSFGTQTPEQDFELLWRSHLSKNVHSIYGYLPKPYKTLVRVYSEEKIERFRKLLKYLHSLIRSTYKESLCPLMTMENILSRWEDEDTKVDSSQATVVSAENLGLCKSPLVLSYV